MSRTLLTMLSITLAAAFAATAYCASDSSSAKDAKSSASSQKDKASLEPYMLDPWDFQDPAKFKSLIKEREDLQTKMYNLRLKLIKDDPDLQKLHEQIMALHKELAIQLDSKKDMRKLTDRLRDIDSSLDKLPRKDSSK